MALPVWNPPNPTKPSAKHKGEKQRETILIAVGEACSEWEFVESALIKLFQLLCETKSVAACRAYGTIQGAQGRGHALRAASNVFFANRDQDDFKEVGKLIEAYGTASGYRNKIAHGVAVQPHSPGYFLCPPSYATKHFDIPDPESMWGLGAAYFYNEKDIKNCTSRFIAVGGEAMRLVISFVQKYKVVGFEELHP